MSDSLVLQHLLLGLTMLLPVVHWVLIFVVLETHLLQLSLVTVQYLLLILLLNHLLLARINFLVKSLHLVILDERWLDLLLVLVRIAVLVRHGSL